MGTSKPHGGSAGARGDRGSALSSQPRGAEHQRGPGWDLEFWGCWLHPRLAGLAVRGAGARLKSQTKAKQGCGCGGSRTMVVVGAG